MYVLIVLMFPFVGKLAIIKKKHSLGLMNRFNSLKQQRSKKRKKGKKEKIIYFTIFQNKSNIRKHFEILTSAIYTS